MNKSENPWKTLRTELKYENPWIKVTESQVLNPAGNPGIYGKVHFKNTAIGIIPLDDELNTWLVGQYRYVLNQYSWEIPEGGGKLGIPPLESAKRELMEETGIVATQWDHIMEVHLSNSVSDELGLIYIARNLRFEEACPEDNEQLQVKKLPFSEVVEMVMRGEITDALAVSGILKANMLLSKNRFQK
jgi:8-oxo-dGTP pyrophosphatase MutT (NUDIX family)